VDNTRREKFHEIAANFNKLLETGAGRCCSELSRGACAASTIRCGHRKPYNSIPELLAMRSSQTLSVLVTNYNQGHFLDESLRAIFSQSWAPTEVIVVDDGSTDDSRRVLDRWVSQHSTLRVLYNDTNMGAYATICRAIEEAGGEYVAGLTADDPLLPGHFMRSMTILSQYAHAGLVCSDYFGVSPEGNLIPYSTLRSAEARYYAPSQFKQELISFVEMSMCTSSAIWRKSVMLESGFLNMNNKWHHDWFATFVAAFRHGLCHIPIRSQIVRFNPRSASVAGMTSGSEYDNVIVNMLELLEGEFADVSSGFAIPAVLSRFGIRGLRILSSDPRFWKYLSPRLIFSALKIDGMVLEGSPDDPSLQGLPVPKLAEFCRGLLGRVEQLYENLASRHARRVTEFQMFVQNKRIAMVARPTPARAVELLLALSARREWLQLRSMWNNYRYLLPVQGMPSNPSDYLVAVVDALVASDFDRAEAAVRSWLKTAHSPVGVILLVHILEQSGRGTEGHAFLSKQRDKYPDSLEIKKAWGSSLRKMGKFANARDVIYSCFVVDPADTVNALELGHTYLALGQHAAAFSVYRNVAVREGWKGVDAVVGMCAAARQLQPLDIAQMLEASQVLIPEQVYAALTTHRAELG
jgi:glycosyltransferase involved in cell wall biosynthesis